LMTTTYVANDIVRMAYDFFHDNGGPHKNYYLGITENLDNRPRAHGVADDTVYTFWQALNDARARQAEKSLLAGGFEGGGGGGNEDAIYVSTARATTRTPEATIPAASFGPADF
ncbi:MAG: hypothetical protein PHV85_07595, partial [Desulfovibrionaceae bacterium]|nr:hypothetical protein [Desulfovibrionaceae bacterium]